MSAIKTKSLAFAGVLLAIGLAAWQAEAEQNDVTFPPIDELTRYTTVERGVTVEHMLTTDEALAAIKAGSPVPVGTQIVLQDFQSGELERFLVAQKMGEGVADWQYQWFWPDGSLNAEIRTDQCYSCHRSREADQFMFTHDGAVSFGG